MKKVSTGLPRCAPIAVLVISILVPTKSQAQLVSKTSNDQYAEAYQLFADGLFERSSAAFELFRKNHPDDVRVPNALYYEAQSLLNAAHYADAVNRLDLFRTNYPNHPLAYEARLSLGKFYYETEQYEEAISFFHTIESEGSSTETSALALFWMAESANQLDRPARALEYLNKLIVNYPEAEVAPSALYSIAYTHVRAKEYTEAAQAFERLSNRYPGSEFTTNLGLALAEVYYELGEYRRVVAEVNDRLGQLSEDARERAYFILAESHNQLRQSDQAILNYRRFLEGNESSPYYRRAQYGLAWNYHFEKAHQWAADEFQKVHTGFDDELAQKALYYEAVNRKLEGRSVDAERLLETNVQKWKSGSMREAALYELAMTKYELRKWDEANLTFAQLLSDYPESQFADEARTMYGNTFIALGNFDSALGTFDEAIRRDAVDSRIRDEILFQKAWLLYRNDRFAESKSAFLAMHEDNSNPDRAAESLFWAAESAFQLNQLQESRQLLSNYLNDYPTGKHVNAAYYSLGWTQFKAGEFEGAIGNFRRFLDRYTDESSAIPYKSDATMRLADSYFALKRYDEAINAYQQLGEAGADYTLYQIGKANANSGRTANAVTTFRSLVDGYPQSELREEAMYSIGEAQFQEGSYLDAVASFQQLVSAYPNDPLAAKAQYAIGDAQFNSGDMESAVISYRRVLDNYPTSPVAADAAASLQYTFIALGDEERADQEIEDFARRNPNSPIVDQLRFKQAEVKFQSGRIDEALADFQQFIRTAKTDDLLPDAYYFVGTIYLDREQMTEAESYLRQVVDRYPSSPRAADAYRDLGKIYYGRSMFARSLEAYQKMEAVTTSATIVGRARYGQALALLKLGRADEAEQLLSGAGSSVTAEGLLAQLGLAQVYKEQGRNDEAISLLRTVASASSDETGAEALVLLGELLIELGQPQAAIDELGRVPALFSGYPNWMAQGYLNQATAFAQLGRRGDAVQMLDLVISQYRGTPYAQTASERKQSI